MGLIIPICFNNGGFALVMLYPEETGILFSEILCTPCAMVVVVMEVEVGTFWGGGVGELGLEELIDEWVNLRA